MFMVLYTFGWAPGMDIASYFQRQGKKGATTMTITPEKKRKINDEIAKFLQHLAAERTDQLSRIDVIDLKIFGLNMHPQPARITAR